MVEPVLARKMWRTLEPYHSMVYFTPHATAAYTALGVAPLAGYFASRSAAMGPVGAEVVIATFYNFHPSVVRAALPGAWEHATPEAVTEARLHAADLALREILGDDAVTSPEVGEAAALARIAAEACTPEGRPIYAAHAALDWPAAPHLALWHAITLLREFRGDGHIAALVTNGVGACEALVTHGATGDSAIPGDILKITRGWSGDEWEAAEARLRDRGWLDDAGSMTPLGEEVRTRIEDQTDALAVAPWAALGGEGSDRLRALVRPWSRAIAGSGVFLADPAGFS